jgi:cytochrome P450 family 110
MAAGGRYAAGVRTSRDDTALPDGPELSAAETSFRWLAHPYQFLDECAEAYGDTFTLRFTRFGTHVVVAHPDEVRTVLTAEHDVLSAGQGNALLEPILGKHSMLLVDGDRHLAQRAVLQPAFRIDQISTYARVATEATRRWTRPWAAGGTVAIHRTALEISKEVILRAMFGLTGSELDRVSRLVHDLMVLVGTNATFDADCDDPRLLHRFRRARLALGEALQDHLERRGGSGAASEGDVLSLLVAARSESGDHLADEEIRDQLITMVLAGHETTASSITWALLCLHDEPEVLQRLLRQLDDVGRDLSDERLAELPYLQAVSLETLRVRPVVPVISRRVQRPFRLGDRTLAAGVFVTPCAYLAHRRADAFASPSAFRPERFLERRPSPYVYFPFGAGFRRCIGMSFALLEMRVVVGMLLRSFRFAPVRAARPVRRAATIVASGGGKMRVEPRRAA